MCALVNLSASFSSANSFIRKPTVPRCMDNDQANFQPLIPAHTTVDVRLGGQVQKLFWSVQVQNLFNALYFDYAVASSATFGRYNAYPLPGRTFLVKAGVTF